MTDRHGMDRQTWHGLTVFSQGPVTPWTVLMQLFIFSVAVVSESNAYKPTYVFPENLDEARQEGGCLRGRL